MTLTEIYNAIQTPEYDFLRTNPKLVDGDVSRVVLIALGGSHAYGTDRPSSDLDIRGVAVNTPIDLLNGTDFEQLVDVPTDTVIYSLDKIIKLFCVRLYVIFQRAVPLRAVRPLGVLSIQHFKNV